MADAESTLPCKKSATMRSLSDSDPYANPMSTPWRLLFCSAILTPALIAAGVYWLHHLPIGPGAHAGHAAIQVDLIATPAPAPAMRQASLQPSPPIADFQVAPQISEQDAAPMQPNTVQQQPAAAMRPAAVPGQTPAGAHNRSVPTNSASRFQRILLSHIERYQYFPASARSGDAEHTVLVIFAMRRDGSILRVGVRSSSGQPVLDQAAIETIRRAQPLPNIPADMPDVLTVALPVTFRAR